MAKKIKQSKHNIDNKDKKIIALLKKDSRMPIRTIARSAGLRPSTVHKRMQDMKSLGIIEKFTIKLNNVAVGEDFIVFMLINTSADLAPSFFADKRIKEAFGVTGEYDLLLKLKFPDIKEFNNYIIGLRKNKNIIKTLTTVVTIPIKEDV